MSALKKEKTRNGSPHRTVLTPFGPIEDVNILGDGIFLKIRRKIISKGNPLCSGDNRFRRKGFFGFLPGACLAKLKVDTGG